MKLCFGNFAKWSGQNPSKNGIWGIVEISTSDPLPKTKISWRRACTCPWWRGWGRLAAWPLIGLRLWFKKAVELREYFFLQNLNPKISQLSKAPPFGWGVEGSLQKSESIGTAQRGSNCPRPKLLVYCPRGDPELPLGCRSIHHTSVCSVLAWKRRGESQKFLLCFRRKPISQLPKQSQELSSFIDLSQWINELSRGPGKLVLIIRRWK